MALKFIGAIFLHPFFILGDHFEWRPLFSEFMNKTGTLTLKTPYSFGVY